jgi:Ca2+-binding EF-hand superfamily protein
LIICIPIPGIVLLSKATTGILIPHKKEFRQFLKAAHQDEQNKYLFEIIDSDGSGLVSLEEFLEWGQAVWEVSQAGDLSRWLKMLFDACDKGQKGQLNKKEFLTFMKYCGTPVGFFQRGKVFKKFDADGSGTVEFDEIIQNMHFCLRT